MKQRLTAFCGVAIAFYALTASARTKHIANVDNNIAPNGNSPVIVKLKPGYSVKTLKQFVAFYGGDALDPIIPTMNIYLMQRTSTKASPSLLSALRQDRRVEWAQLDHPVTLRSAKTSHSLAKGKTSPAKNFTASTSSNLPLIPNDPDFNKLWGMHNPTEGVDSAAASTWKKFGTGGKDILGHEIVLGLNDNGLDLTHRDIKNNVWTNSEEIPGNQIDDDQNGLVDDVHGWDFRSNSSEIPAGDHGTHVAGTMGAEGGNGLHVTGVNWNVKIIPVTTAAENTSKVLKSYGYYIYQKKLWLESGAHRGANVVAVNSSWGIDYAKCDSGDYPAWNDVFNEMGKYGILAVSATINNHTDVDHDGDVPTSCSSPYVVSVTNINRQGHKNSQAGFGRMSIDLGAPGTDVYSIVPGDRIASYSGTSMATPHVTGAIGLLYSAASRDFAQYAFNQPAEASLQLKKILLETTTPQDDLNGKTVSGGRLNILKAAERISQFLTPQKILR